MKFKTNRALLAVLLGIGAFALPDAYAATPIFTYANRDVMLCFRKAGANNDLEVNIGQASIYYSAAPGAVIPVSAYSASQLNDAFDSLDDLSWSAGAAVRIGDGGDGSVPVGTLWLTAPRSDVNVQASPWPRQSSSVQANTVARIKSILDNASFYSGTIPANASSNTASVVAVPVGSGHEYSAFMGPYGNYNNTFIGDVENTTSPSFDSDNVASRSDFYEIRPDSSATLPSAKYLGYFEFSADGSMVFKAAVSGPAAPVLSITASNNTQTISFATANNVTYTLHYTDAAGLASPLSSWSTVATNIVGNGQTQSFQQAATAQTRFYVVAAH